MNKSGGSHGHKPAARAWIEALLDGASFVELGRYFEQTSTTPGFECAGAPGEGVITGFGTLNGRPVYVFAQDQDVLGGSMSRGHAEKIVKILDMALKNGAPVIGILASVGARVTEGAAAMGAYNTVIKKLTEISGVAPTVALAAGPCIGAASVLPCLFDFTVAVEGLTNIVPHSPLLTEAVHVNTEPQKIVMSGAQLAHNKGVAQFLAADVQEAVAIVQKLLSFLPQNNLEDAPDTGAADDLNRQISLPDAPGNVNARQLITMIADNGDFMEVYAGFGPGLVTGFIRLGGESVGVVANEYGAILTAAGCRKTARFISILDAYHMPVLTLADCGDIPPGVQDPGLLVSISLLISAYSGTTSPMVTVVTGKLAGAGLLAMCPGSAGADMVYAWKDAVLSALPVETGALIFYDDEIRKADDPSAMRQEAVQKYQTEFAGAQEAARQGLVDDVIEPSATRQMVIAAFEACISKRLAAKPPKKHGILPL